VIASLNGAAFVVPDELVDHYVLDFQPLKNWEHRDNLIIIREDILDIFDIVMEDPEALYDPEFLEEFVNTLAMRQALQTLCILHDA